MKKGTKFALFAAAAAGIAVVGSKLAQMVRLQNEELNDMINQAPAPAPEEEDTSDYVMPGDAEPDSQPEEQPACCPEDEAEAAAEEDPEDEEYTAEDEPAEDVLPDDEEPLA